MTKILRAALSTFFVVGFVVIASVEMIGAQEQPAPLPCEFWNWGDYCGTECDDYGILCWETYYADGGILNCPFCDDWV